MYEQTLCKFNNGMQMLQAFVIKYDVQPTYPSPLPGFSKTGFLNLSTIDAWRWLTLCCEVSYVLQDVRQHPGLYSPDASTIIPVRTMENFSNIATCFRDIKSVLVGDHCFRSRGIAEKFLEVLGTSLLYQLVASLSVNSVTVVLCNSLSSIPCYWGDVSVRSV